MVFNQIQQQFNHKKIHLAASSLQPEQNPDGVILLSGVVEEKVYTGKCVDLNENLCNWAQYKIKSNINLFKINTK